MMKKNIKCAVAFMTLLLLFPNYSLHSDALEVTEYYSASDVVKLKNNILGKESLTDDEKNKFDVNKDGSVNTVDFSFVKNAFMLKKNEPPADNPRPERYRLNVDMIKQNPELPTGCEVTSLTMLLNYDGFNADKVYLARNFMPKFSFVFMDGTLYGADFITTFQGNPELSSGYGCYTPCMVTTAENYFNSIGNDDYYLKDLKGSEFDELFSYVAAGRPVMVWATMNMVEPVAGNSWTTPEGKTVTWTGNEHCLVITGYDKINGIVYVNDPLKGEATYSINIFNLRYNEMGKYAAVLLDKNEELDTPEVKHYVGEKVTYTGPVYYSSFGGKSVNVSGDFTITEIVDDETRPYRIRLGTAGWVPYDFSHN